MLLKREVPSQSQDIPDCNIEVLLNFVTDVRLILDLNFSKFELGNQNPFIFIHVDKVSCAWPNNLVLPYIFTHSHRTKESHLNNNKKDHQNKSTIKIHTSKTVPEKKRKKVINSCCLRKSLLYPFPPTSPPSLPLLDCINNPCWGAQAQRNRVLSIERKLNQDHNQSSITNKLLTPALGNCRNTGTGENQTQR